MKITFFRKTRWFIVACAGLALVAGGAPGADAASSDDGDSARYHPLAPLAAGTADIKLVSQTPILASSFNAGEPVNLVVNKTIHNNGPDGPVAVTVTKSVTMPVDCYLNDLGPGGTQILTETVPGVVVSTAVPYVEEDVVSCGLPGDKQITIVNCLAPEIGVTDPNSLNNCAPAVLTFVVDDGDLVPHTAEIACGSDRDNPAATPERMNGVDDDGDMTVDEGLPLTAPPQDCDGDGYTGAVEAGTPLCGNGLNDDGVANGGPDDSIVDDGCPGGPPQSGMFSEAQFKVGTNDQVTCGTTGWASDFVSGGIPDSTNKVNVLDVTNGFLAPVYRMNTSPGHANFSSRSDLLPGRGLFASWTNISDVTALLAGNSGFPRIFHGDRAFGGATCRDQMHNILAPDGDQEPVGSKLYVGNLSWGTTDSAGGASTMTASLGRVGRGLSVVDTSRYSSRIVLDGPYGWNWDSAHNRRLLVQPSGNVMRMDGGRGDWYLLQPNGTFRAPAGSFTSLVRNGNGTYDERYPDGTLVQYNAMRAGLARVALIRDRFGNQVTYTYNANDLVATVRDDLGRSNTYVYNAQGRLSTAADYTGRVITHTYDALGNLETVTQPAVTSTSTGNNFAAGKTTRYTYSSGMSDPRHNHNLTTIMAPNEYPSGPTLVSLMYGSGALDSDRVISATVGGTNGSGVPSGGTETFAYSIVNPSPPEPLNSVYRRVTVVDGNGNQKEFDLSRRHLAVEIRELSNRDIRPTDPVGWGDVYEHNTDGQAIEITMPEGNKTTFTYDSGNANRLAQGNLLSVQVEADSDRGGDQIAITESWTYEPIYNQVKTATEPRGNDATYVPDNGGVQSLDRYTSLNRFDYEEGCDFSAIGAKVGRSSTEVMVLLTGAGMCSAPAGDLNLDANTSQVSGSTILARAPSVDVDGDSFNDAWESESFIDLDCDGAVDDDGDRYVNDGCPAVGAEEANAQCDDAVDSDGDSAVNDGCPPKQIHIEMVQLNLFGQPTLVKDEESNVHTFEYYPENDPNGDGTIDCATCSSVTGGYLRQSNIDTASDPLRNSGTNPTPVNIRNRYLYNARGAVTRFVDGRGVATDYERNQLDQVIVESRAAAVGVYAPDPPEFLAPTADAFLTRYWYDANDNVVLVQSEDRGNTRAVDGNLPSGDLPVVAPNPDPTGGTAYQDTVYEYDIRGMVLEVLEEAGSSIGPPEHPRTQYRYDRNGNLALTRSPRSNLGSGDPDLQLSNVVSAVYDERDMVATSTRGGTTAQWQALAANGDIPGGASIPNSAGLSTEAMAYDGNRSLVAWTDGQDSDGVGGAETTLYRYDGFDRLVSEIDPAGGQTYTRFSPDGTPVRASAYGPTGGATPTDNSAATLTQPLTPSSFTQQQLGRSDAKYDELSRAYETNDHLYACNGSTPVCTGVTYVRTPVIIDGPLGGLNDGLVIRRWEYDRANRTSFEFLDHLATPVGYEVGYDGAGRVVKRVTPDDTVEVANPVYDDNGNVQRYDLIERSTTGVVPAVTETFTNRYTYDGHNRLVRAIDPLGQTRAMTYDSSNYLVAWSDAKGALTSDPLGQYPGMINTSGNTGSHLYDGLGRQLAGVSDLRLGGTGGGAIDTTNPSNPDGRVVADTKYDVNGLVRGVADDGSVSGDNNTSIGLIEASSPLGNVTRTVYDDLNRPTQVQYDDGTMVSYAYDRDDNVTQVTDQNGSVFVYSYDALERVRQVSVTPGTGVANSSTLRTYQYDGMDRLVRATDNNDPVPSTDDSTVELAYDSLGRLLEERQQVGTGPGAVVSSQYDGAGRRVALIYPDSRRINYEYDALSRLVRTQDAAEPFPTATYSYVGERLLERQYVHPMTGAPGVRLTMRNPTTFAVDGYDGARRPVRVRHLGPAPINMVIADFQHILDREGNRTEELRNHANRVDTYTYDSLYRLTTFMRDGTISPPGPGTPTSYTLDGNGNWDNFATDNNMNEYSVFQGKSRTYDNNGNLLMTGTMPTEFNYSYDAWSQLRSVSTGGGGIPVSTSTYDAMGRRTAKTVTNSGAFNDSFAYSYDGGGLIVEDGALSGSRDYVGSSASRARDIDGHGTHTSGTSSSMRVDATTVAGPQPPLFYHGDGKGNVAALTNLAQAPVERYDYDAYGVPTFKDGAGVPTGGGASANGNPFLFAGMHWEPESRLYSSAGASLGPRESGYDPYPAEVYKPDEGRTLTGADGGSRECEQAARPAAPLPGCGGGGRSHDRRGSSVYTLAGGNPASGAVLDCKIAFEKCAGRPRGFGFVELGDLDPRMKGDFSRGHQPDVKRGQCGCKEKFVRDKPHVNVGDGHPDFLWAPTSSPGSKPKEIVVVGSKVKEVWQGGTPSTVHDTAMSVIRKIGASGSSGHEVGHWLGMYYGGRSIRKNISITIKDRSQSGATGHEVGHWMGMYHGGAGPMSWDNVKNKSWGQGDTGTHEVGHWMGMYHGGGGDPPGGFFAPNSDPFTDPVPMCGQHALWLMRQKACRPRMPVERYRVSVDLGPYVIDPASTLSGTAQVTFTPSSRGTRGIQIESSGQRSDRFPIMIR